MHQRVGRIGHGPYGETLFLERFRDTLADEALILDEQNADRADGADDRFHDFGSDLCLL